MNSVPCGILVTVGVVIVGVRVGSGQVKVLVTVGGVKYVFTLNGVGCSSGCSVTRVLSRTCGLFISPIDETCVRKPIMP